MGKSAFTCVTRSFSGLPIREGECTLLRIVVKRKEGQDAAETCQVYGSALLSIGNTTLFSNNKQQHQIIPPQRG